MIHYSWVLAAFVFGGSVGVFLMALIQVGRGYDE